MINETSLIDAITYHFRYLICCCRFTSQFFFSVYIYFAVLFHVSIGCDAYITPFHAELQIGHSNYRQIVHTVGGYFMIKKNIWIKWEFSFHNFIKKKELQWLNLEGYHYDFNPGKWLDKLRQFPVIHWLI